MELSKKAAYIKGLAEGLELDSEDKNTKIIKAIIDIVSDIADEVCELEQCYDDVCDQVDSLKDDVSLVEGLVYNDDYDDYDEYYGSSCECPACVNTDDEDNIYEVTCPTCGKTIILDEDELSEGEIDCPECGETLEFDYDDSENDEYEINDNEVSFAKENE